MVYYKYNTIVGPLSEKIAIKCTILNMSGRTDGTLYYNIRNQTCYEAILLVCYYPSIGGYCIGWNQLVLYQVGQSQGTSDIFLQCHWAFYHTHYKFLNHKYTLLESLNLTGLLEYLKYQDSPSTSKMGFQGNFETPLDLPLTIIPIKCKITNFSFCLCIHMHIHACIHTYIHILFWKVSKACAHSWPFTNNVVIMRLLQKIQPYNLFQMHKYRSQL